MRVFATARWSVLLLGVFLGSVSVCAGGDEYTFLLRNGEAVRGELVDFTVDRHYVIRANGELRRIDEREVRSMTPLGAGAGDVVDGGVGVEWIAGEEMATAVSSTVEAARDALERGQAAARAEDLAAAEDLLRQAVAEDPWFLPARLALVDVLIRTESFSQAEDALGEILEIDPCSLPAIHLLARCYRATGRHEDYLRTLDRLLGLRFHGGEAAYRRAHFWLSQGQIGAARRAWEEFRTLDPGMVAPYCEEGHLWRSAEALASAGDLEKAIDAYYEATQRNGLLAGEATERIRAAHATLAGRLREAGDLNGALAEYDMLAEMTPEDRAHWMREKFDALREELGHSLEARDAGRLTAAFNRVRASLSPEDGADLLAQVIEALPDPADAGAGGTGLSLARAVAAQCTATMPTGEVRDRLVQVLLDYAAAARDAGDVESALDTYRELRRICPQRGAELDVEVARVYMTLAVQASEAGRHVDARDAYRRALDLADLEEARAGYAAETWAQARELALATAELSERIRVLEGYLAGKKQPEVYVAEATKMLEGIQEDLRQQRRAGNGDAERFFHYTPGSWFRYRRGDGSLETLHVRKVQDEEYERIYVMERLRNVDESGEGISTHTYEVRRGPQEAYIRRSRTRESILRFPIRAGDSWVWEEGGFRLSRTVLSRDARVRTELAEFTGCVQVEFRTTLLGSKDDPMEVVSHNYYAPGIGLVKIEVPGDASGRMELELVAYHIAE